MHSASVKIGDRTGSDRGQAAVAVVMVAAALFAVTVVALVTLGHRTLDQVRAQTAADSAALGGLHGGKPVAAELADAHGAELVEFVAAPRTGVVTVVVRVGDRTATAAATDAVEVP